MSIKSTILVVGLVAVGVTLYYTTFENHIAKNSVTQQGHHTPLEDTKASKKETLQPQEEEKKNIVSTLEQDVTHPIASASKSETNASVASSKKIKTYKEQFVAPESLSQVEKIQEHQEIEKLEEKVQALLSKADATIEERGLVVPSVVRDEKAQEALEKFEHSMESLNAQLEELNHAI